MKKKVKITNFQDLVDILNSEEYRSARASDYDFSTYRYDYDLDTNVGRENMLDNMMLQIWRNNALNTSMMQTDTDALAVLSADELRREIDLHTGLIHDEYAAIRKLTDALQARQLYRAILQRLLDRADLVATPHTHNEWKREEWDREGETQQTLCRSNAVYEMSYYVYYETEYNRETREMERNGQCRLNWSFCVRTPSNPSRATEIIASQRRKFKSEEEMRKYLAGRIKAYDKYFQEDFPPVPKEYLHHFTYAGQLLPGYREEVQA